MLLRRLSTATGAAASAVRSASARVPLRVKLVAGLVLLVVGALVGSGLAATATLRGYLVNRVDTQLQSVAHEMTGRGGPHEPDDASPPGLPSAFVIEVTDSSGAIVYGPNSNLVDADQPLPRLPHGSEFTNSAPAAPVTTTVPAVQGNSRWRVLATPVVLPGNGTGTLYVAQSLADVQNTVGHLTVLLLVIGAAAVVVLAGVGYVVVRASLRPLHDVERTAAAIAAGDLSRRVPQSDRRTEVGQLSAALNGMLAQIESAFAVRAASEEAARRSEEQMRRSEAAARRSEDRMRRFVADASHELRTPLTSIRGFAELYRQGAAADPADVKRLMRRIEDEAKRMGLLVEDLLLLARLDQQRPLEQAPVDVLALANDAVHDARAVDPARPIRLDVGATDPPPVVVGDHARLSQVLANLVSNALRHTPTGTAVDVRVRTDAERQVVVLEVADRGAGMAAEDAARVFERFYRADPSRSRSDGGTGLGLAIVAALVAGHGGTVAVDTAPGEGACFRVELPLASVTVVPA